MDDLKLYVWHDSLIDYTSGVMFALASGVEEARALVVAHTPHASAGDLAEEPSVYGKSVGFAVWGGG